MRQARRALGEWRPQRRCCWWWPPWRASHPGLASGFFFLHPYSMDIIPCLGLVSAVLTPCQQPSALQVLLQMCAEVGEASPGKGLRASRCVTTQRTKAGATRALWAPRFSLRIALRYSSG